MNYTQILENSSEAEMLEPVTDEESEAALISEEDDVSKAEAAFDALSEEGRELFIEKMRDHARGIEGGYVYVLMNPCLPYVKIGYSKNPEERLKQINAHEAVPYSFSIVLTFRTVRIGDFFVHRIIDILNPDLRTVETTDGGKLRKKEFFEMTPEEAIILFRSIAALTGQEDHLTIYETSLDQRINTDAAEEVTRRRHRRPNFNFSDCHIPVGARITFLNNEDIVITVANDRQVEYNGEVYYLSNLAKELVPEYSGTPGIAMFGYNGKSLYDYYNEHHS